jgi:hypothetical protein
VEKGIKIIRHGQWTAPRRLICVIWQTLKEFGTARIRMDWDGGVITRSAGGVIVEEMRGAVLLGTTPNPVRLRRKTKQQPSTR